MDNSGHSIFAATAPEMTNFFNCSKEKLYDTQLGANFMLIYRTPEIVEKVLRWWVLCALEPECMQPKGAQLWCKFAPKD